MSFTLSGLQSLEKAYQANPLAYSEKLAKADRDRLAEFLESVELSLIHIFPGHVLLDLVAYERQEVFLPLGHRVLAECYVIPVSYTHLDVYKRQVYEVSPYVTRLRLMWENMRDKVVELFPEAPGKRPLARGTSPSI